MMAYQHHHYHLQQQQQQQQLLVQQLPRMPHLPQLLLAAVT
jgi:hypothetical protein